MVRLSQDLIPHQLGLTKSQISKLIDGKPVNIPYKMMGSGAGDVVINLRPQNARKLLTAYKKGKGMRLTMHPLELESSMKNGRGFFKSLKKYTGVNKTDFINESKKIGKQVVAEGATAVGAAIGMYTGNPAAGAMIGEALGRAGEKTIDSIEPSKSKMGVKFNPRAGVASLKNDAKMYAVEAIDRQVDKLPPDQKAIAERVLAGQYPEASNLIYDGAIKQPSIGSMYGYGLKKGSQEMKDKMAMIRSMRGKGVGKKITGALKSATDPFASKKAVNVYKKIGKHAIEQGIPLAATLASMALGDPTGMSGAMVGNVASEYASDAYSKKTGSGARRGRPRKVVGAGATVSKAYKNALRLNYSGLKTNEEIIPNAPLNNFSVNRNVRPSSNEMTLSPYERIDSPAMNPFIPTNSVQAGGTSCGYGGKGLYGGGLYPR